MHKARKDGTLFYLMSGCGRMTTTNSSSSSRRRIIFPPSTSDLRKDGFMRMILDEEEVKEAFDVFKACPLAQVSCELQEDSDIQRKTALEMNSLLSLSAPSTNPPENDRRKKDARRAVVSMDCTMATYAEKFFSGDCDNDAGRERRKRQWMGQMMLQGVVNVPYERCFVPMEVCDLQTLLSCSMLETRIFNIYVQHNSRLLLKRAMSEATHRFSEWNLCNPISSYESMGWTGRFFRD